VCVCLQKEAEAYCPFVTQGSYCIIQDTKLGRFATVGPLRAAKDYAAKYSSDFTTDRTVEPFYTQHAFG
jgi:cephalosporin hydroxylase